MTTDHSVRFRVTRAELARLLATTPDRISKYIAEGLPVVTRGAGRGKPTILDLAEALPWLLQRRTGSFDEARTRYYTAQADKVELETRHRRGELIAVDAVRVEYQDMAAVVKARLRGIPSAIAEQVVKLTPATAHALMLARIDDALRELARENRERKTA